VRSPAKGDVPLAIEPIEAELVGVVKVRRVSVGGAPQQQQARTGGQAYRHVDGKAEIRDAVVVRGAGRIGQLMASHPIMFGRTDLPASPVIAGPATELTGIGADDPRAAQWIVHLVLSLVHQPIGNSRTEREILDRFVAPAFEPQATTFASALPSG
jgi:hypothetical protein